MYITTVYIFDIFIIYYWHIYKIKFPYFEEKSYHSNNTNQCLKSCILNNFFQKLNIQSLKHAYISREQRRKILKENRLCEYFILSIFVVFVK